MCPPKKPKIEMPEERKVANNTLANDFLDGIYTQALNQTNARLGTSMLRIGRGSGEDGRRTPGRRPNAGPEPGALLDPNQSNRNTVGGGGGGMRPNNNPRDRGFIKER